MNAQDAIVYVVDDDPLIQEALDGLIRSAGLRVRTFASAPDFLRSHLSDAPACLVLDGIYKAIEQDRIARSERAHLADVRARFQSLTRREREVMQLVVAGLLNK